MFSFSFVLRKQIICKTNNSCFTWPVDMTGYILAFFSLDSLLSSRLSFFSLFLRPFFSYSSLLAWVMVLTVTRAKSMSSWLTHVSIHFVRKRSFSLPLSFLSVFSFSSPLLQSDFFLCDCCLRRLTLSLSLSFFHFFLFLSSSQTIGWRRLHLQMLLLLLLNES